MVSGDGRNGRTYITLRASGHWTARDHPAVFPRWMHCEGRAIDRALLGYLAAAVSAMPSASEMRGVQYRSRRALSMLK